jgi:very-short-patch-repair endonuclease
MQTKDETPATVLGTLMPEVKDWALLLKELWYRIPIDNVPPILENGQAKYIAFYHTAKFKEDLKGQIVYYAEIKRVVIATRRELFPTESPYHGKANKQYYKVEFDALIPLPKPIVSRRGHRILFVPTTEEQFFSESTNFNKVFKNSYLEARMTDIMEDMNIVFEREFAIHVDDNRKYHLDFAIFCKKGKIDIECDGDTYHMGYDNVYYDKTRNNELESIQWKVLRYTTKHFQETGEKHIRKTMYKTIKDFEGCLDAQEPEAAYQSNPKPKVSTTGQIKLFSKD